jgi:hypothetical protein
MNIRKYFLAMALVTGIAAGTFAKPGPQDACNVTTRLELNMLCGTGSPICCQFLAYTVLTDTNEVFYEGEYVFGWYTPIE